MNDVLHELVRRPDQLLAEREELEAPMTPRWLTGWVTHPSFWVDIAITAVLGAAVIFIVVVMLGWR